MTLLQIKNLHAGIENKKILKGVNLEMGYGEVHAIMGPNGSGKSTLASIITGKPGYEVFEGEILFEGKDLLELEPEERATAGIFLSFQYPVEIPGVSNINFIKTAVNEVRKNRGQRPYDAFEFMNVYKKAMKLLQMPEEMKSRSLNEGFSGGEKKRNEILQMVLLEPKLAILDETDSGLDIDSLRIVGDAINKTKDGKRSFLVITHYPRILQYIKPDFVHIFLDGKIVKTGDASLAEKLEKEGYDWVKKEIIA